MSREIRFVQRSLISGLTEIFQSNPFLALCSFLLILGISSVIPLAFIWLLQNFIWNFHLIPITSPFFSTILTIWSIVEVSFLFYQVYLYAYIQNRLTGPVMTPTERHQLVSNALANMKNLKTTLSKWFLDRPVENLDRQSVIGWLAFAFFSKKAHELTDYEYEEITTLMNKIEVEHELPMNNEQSDKTLYYMKHIIDPVRVIVRPFVFYAVTDTLLNGIIGSNIFYWRGYKYVEMGHLQFWTYRDEALDENDEQEPIIFFHGIGAGLVMYQPFIARLHQQFSRKHRLIFISMRCICMRYPSLNDIPNMNETVTSIRQIFEHHKFNKATFIGHSYGTACLSWIVQKCPEYIARLIFIDPICFALFEPYVVYNFVYRIPHKLGHLYMYYFVCRELGISYVISRHFWWTQNNLFIEQTPVKAKQAVPIHVLLSSNDCIVNVHLVKEYLIKHQIDYYWALKLSHGGFMHDRPSWEMICQWLS